GDARLEREAAHQRIAADREIEMDVRRRVRRDLEEEEHRCPARRIATDSPWTAATTTKSPSQPPASHRAGRIEEARTARDRIGELLQRREIVEIGRAH